jgi:hypothetical protein
MPIEPYLARPAIGLAVATGEDSDMPKPSTRLPPVISSNFCATSTGSAEPPLRHALIERRLYSVTRGWLIMAMYIVGTPG